MEWLTNFFDDFWDTLLKWFWWLIDSLFTPFSWLADGVRLIIYSTLYYIFDGFLTVVEFFLNSIDAASFGFLNLFSNQVHPLFIWFIGQLGTVQGFGIISSALALRFLLNLIPSTFTRI
jgi:hypothetical protein